MAESFKVPHDTSQMAEAAVSSDQDVSLLSQNPEGPNRLPKPVDSQMQDPTILFVNPNGDPPAEWNQGGDNAQSN
jgi:hypothetical protein